MKSSVETISNLERKLTVEVTPEAVQRSFQSAYSNVRKSATIKGFRKGKAPLDKIKSLYQEKITPDVLNDLINEHYGKAIDEHEISPIDYPQINVDQFDEKALKFTATVEIRPQVELKNYEGLKVQKEKLEIDENKVESILEDLRQRQATTAPLLEDRPAATGDISKIDFAGFINGGEELPGGQGTDFDLELGSDQFIPGFEEGVIGMKVGTQKDIQLTFPDDYHANEIAGKDVTFKVTLKSLQKKVLPEINDELAKSIGDHDSLEDLKQAIRDDIRSGEEKRIHDDLKDRLLKALVAANPVDVPPSMMKKQKKALIEDLHQKMHQQGMDHEQFEEYKKKWDGDFENTAAQMIQSSFLIGEIASKHQLTATSSDFENKLQGYVEQSGIELERIREFYDKPEQRNRLDFQITEDKVVDLLLSTAQADEVAAAVLKK